MLELILSKAALMVFGLAVLIASGSLISSYYLDQETEEANDSMQKITGILRQIGSFGGELESRLDMREYLSSESVLRIGNGSLFLLSGGKTFSADLSDDATIKMLGEDRSETALIDVTKDDIMVIERRNDDGALRTMIYIENVDATFSTASTNLSTSSTVL